MARLEIAFGEALANRSRLVQVGFALTRVLLRSCQPLEVQRSGVENGALRADPVRCCDGTDLRRRGLPLERGCTEREPAPQNHERKAAETREADRHDPPCGTNGS